jgi:dGTPase
LDAACKYPWVAAEGEVKYGAYADDAAVFAWVREGAPGRRRCLEAQIMDWADDVAYSVHDVEDGIVSGRIDLVALGDAAERDVLVDLAARHFGGDPGALREAGRDLMALDVVAALRHVGVVSTAGQLALKRLTSELVGRFVLAATDATRDVYGEAPLARYGAGLVVPATVGAEVALLKAVALRYVMRDPDRLRMQARQRELLTELAHALLVKAPDALDPVFADAWGQAADDAARLRVVIDQVAVLTDQQAIARHRSVLGGPSEP